jgi:hypothetical protein
MRVVTTAFRWACHISISAQMKNVKGLRINVSGNLVIISNSHDFCGMGSVLDNRGSVKGLSVSSAYRMRRYLRETKCEYKSMCTLTYPDGFGIDGKRAKNDLRRFIQELRRRKFDDRWGCFWFLEFQRNGRIHFHLLLTHFYEKEWISELWFSIVGSKIEAHRKVGTRIESLRLGRDGISSYVSKYCSKFDQKLIPEGFGWAGRFWGVQGYRHLVAAATFIPQGLKGAKYVQNGIKWAFEQIKRLESAKICKNISQHFKNADPRIFRVWKIENSNRFEAEKIANKINFIELWLAIHEGREPRINRYDFEKSYGDFVDNLRMAS